MASYNDISNIMFNEQTSMPDVSDESDSPSLPSLSIHGQLIPPPTQMSLSDLNMTGLSGNDGLSNINGKSCVSASQLMTVREYDNKLNELKKENFQLKLRIYMIEKEKTGVTQPEGESAIARELLKREKTIKAYHKIVAEKEKSLKEMKHSFEIKLKEKESQMEGLINEKEIFENELKETASVCRLLMTHLSEFVDFWKRYLPVDGNEDPTNPTNYIACLLNSSTDLLNSASILISNEADESLNFSRKNVGASNFRSFLSGNVDANVNASYPHSGPSYSIPGDGSFLPYSNSLTSNRNYNQPQVIRGLDCNHFYNAISSESDDVWSEPDRDESRARIGLDDEITAFVPIIHNAKSKHKRRSSATGMSSLGLLTDISEIMDQSRAQTSSNLRQQVPSSHKSIQAEIMINDSPCKCAPISVASNEVKDTSQHILTSTSTQYEPPDCCSSDCQTQTEDVLKVMKHMASQTSHTLVSRNTSCNLGNGENDMLLKQLENMKLNKQKMEKAITKQLLKTDRILKKAKNNLKEN